MHTRQRTLVAHLRLRLLLAVGLLLGVIMGSLVARTIVVNAQQQQGQQVVILYGDVNSILSSMLDQQVGIRGYVNTADPRFLEPFTRGRSQYLSSVQHLQAYIQHDSQFSATRLALKRVEARAASWYTAFALVQMHEVQAGIVTLPRSNDRRLQGKDLFVHFRAQVAVLQASIIRDLTVIQARVDTTNRLTIGSATVLALLALLFFWWTFSRFGRNLGSQLASLKQTALFLGGGNLAVRVDGLQFTELQQVGQTLNTMAEAIQQQQESLRMALLAAEVHFTQLERTKSQQRAIIDASQEAMLFLSPNGRPMKVNTRFTDFFGIDDTTALSQTPDQLTALLKEQLVDGSSLDRALAEIARDQKRIFQEQQVQAAPGGREFNFSSLPVINVDSAYIGRLYVWHDVTHERAVDRMKSEFVSLVSHELRTPLTSIQGYIELLLTDEEVGPLNDLQEEFLGIVQNNARRLVSLINDLLDISHMESGKMKLNRKPLDINLLISELLPSFQPGWDASRQTFTLHLPKASPLVLGDSERVAQILSNLLSNAHKYTPEEGRIDLSVEAAGPFARIAVTDSGIGLSGDEQAQLFTRFYRASNATTEMVGGTGLGLTITRSLVEMQGGQILVSSEPGRGSTFCFTLPLADPLGLAAFPQKPLPGKRILVVDDEPDIRLLLQHTLQSAGYEVITASSGKEAFQLAQTARPDLITLDMRLPDSSGLIVLEWLKNDPATASIPVMLLTIVDDDGQGQLLGATDHLSKPIKVEDLLQRISQSLSAGTSTLTTARPEEKEEEDYGLLSIEC